MSTEYEKGKGSNTHKIESNNVMVCNETGRVVAVFYNDYDLEDVLTKLNGRSDR